MSPVAPNSPTALKATFPELSAAVLSGVYRPLARWLETQRGDGPLIVAVSGWPGTGKSTLVRVLRLLLTTGPRWTVAVLSLDDVYCTRAERQHLAATIHPLLEQRGVPGTHDTALALRVIAQLRSAGNAQLTSLPRFDKHRDDRLPEQQWPALRGRPDVILLDGWFWGAQASTPDALKPPCSEFEREQDPDGAWRRYVNEALERDYPPLFNLAARHVHLAAPDWESSVRWRLEQERRLFASLAQPVPADMVARVQHFLKPFKRVAHLALTRPSDVHLSLDRNHDIVAVQAPGGWLAAPPPRAAR